MRRVLLPLTLLMLAAIAAFAFVLSFTALTDLAARNAVPAHQAWMIPVVVDTTIIAATLAVVTLSERRWYAWALLATAAVLSVAGNIAHAWSFGPIAIVIAAVPPLFLLAMTELAVCLTRPAGRVATVRPLFPKELVKATPLPSLTGRWTTKSAA